MSSPHREREKRRLREEQSQRETEEREVETWRKENLSMWERITEADASDDVKDILHRIAIHVGLEDE